MSNHEFALPPDERREVMFAVGSLKRALLISRKHPVEWVSKNELFGYSATALQLGSLPAEALNAMRVPESTGPFNTWQLVRQKRRPERVEDGSGFRFVIDVFWLASGATLNMTHHDVVAEATEIEAEPEKFMAVLNKDRREQFEYGLTTPYLQDYTELREAIYDLDTQQGLHLLPRQVDQSSLPLSADEQSWNAQMEQE